MSHATENCPKIRQHLALYAGRDLEEPLCVEVERHLAECESCRIELARAGQARERIAVLGVQTARGVEAIDLWPALGERWASEKSAATRAPSRTPRRSRRILIPLALAAAAALVIAQLWNSEPASQAVPPISHVADPIVVPVEDVAQHAPGAQRALDEPGTDDLQSGGLRRAAPGEERLRDSSAPFGLPLAPWLRRAAQDTPNSLAGNNDLR
jgi:hypothetical protein